MNNSIRIGFFAVAGAAAIPTAASAQTATDAWTKIIKRCASTSMLGKQSLFFGFSNSIGPGSVWRLMPDKSVHLLYTLSDAVPKADEQGQIVKQNNSVSCSGTSSSNWNLKLGLPFSTGATPVTIDLSTVFGQAKKVTVSIDGYSMDVIAETNWKVAIAALGKGSPYFQELETPGRVVAANSIKVTGLKVVFDYDHDLSAEIQAKYHGTSFVLGAASVGASATSGKVVASPTQSNSTSVAATTINKGTASMAGSTATDKSGTSTVPASETSCSAPLTAPGGSASASGTGKQAADSGANSLATLSVSVTGSRQLTICAKGPAYIIASYSQLGNGTIIGVAPSVDTLSLSQVSLPSGAVATGR